MHGFTERISQKMKEDLGDDVVLVNLKKERNPRLSPFSRVIIGGSIHAGKIQKRVREFCNRYSDELKEKEIGLFICCVEEGVSATSQLMNAFPEELRMVAKSTAIFKGCFDFEHMNFFDRFFVRKITGVKTSNVKVDFEAVRMFSKRMDRIFNPFLFLS